MAAFKWRRWNNAIHRDFGYFFFGMTVIYALSGIALNHIRDWNPNYIIRNWQVTVNIPEATNYLSEDQVFDILSQAGLKNEYKKHYFRDKQTLKIFLDHGSATFNLETGTGTVETIRRRPLFHQVNFLHYNPSTWWTWFSDIYAGALVLLAITGLFVLRGKNGITRRGAWITLAGIIIPLIFLFVYKGRSL
ncbi:MAG TPA: PepSY-associated TM helix domain-containing protein [Bacteroidales bacterium]|nr:PepSY-associated TM helix domain-containing protein [Bacteroidales bacterium]HNS46734.1 PepSY-associated TM helix domain-containing protein [Bacteroidales bacterium]